MTKTDPLSASGSRLSVSQIRPVQRSRIVAEQLLAAIRNQGLRMGDKLPTERELAKAMNVSRNTLREAIAALQLLGFFEVRRSSGIFLIKHPDDSEIFSSSDEITEIDFDPYTAADARIALEPGTAIAAARAATPEDWDALEKICDTMARAIAKRDFARYSRYDTIFHQQIVKATHNDFLISAVMPVVNAKMHPLWTTMKANVHTLEIRKASCSEHRLILYAMRLGDDYMIFRTMMMHLINTKNRAEERMLEEEADQD